MAQGLQIFDENGNCTLDLTDRLCKVLGTVDTGFTGGSITNPLFAEGDFWVIDLKIDYQDGGNRPVKGQEFPHFYKSGTTLYWSYGNNYDGTTRLSRKVLYGVY